jgi:hypothetical protein
MFFWELYMKEWEKKLERNRYEILDRLKINNDKLDEIINVFKEYEVIIDKD